ncbi:MAG: hypothetical protein U0235_03220 [Polyangiaceae bacterium]
MPRRTAVPRRFAHLAPAFAALACATIVGCLEDLPAPLSARAGGTDAGEGGEGGALACATNAATTTSDCSSAISNATQADPKCYVGLAAEACLLGPSGVACDATCAPVGPACRAACPSAVAARAPSADCSPAHTAALGDDPSTAACYKLRCPRTQCLDACDDRGQVVGASRYSNLPNDVVLDVGLSAPPAGRLGVHGRYRGVFQVSAIVTAGTTEVRRYEVPGGAAGTTSFTDVVLLDATTGGAYSWSAIADAPTRVTFALAGDYPFAVAEVDCVTPFYLPL